MRFIAPTLVLLTLSIGAWKSATSTSGSAADVCAEGPVPVVWPIGDNGFVAQRLYNSHGQFLDLIGSDRYIHRGIDVAACVGDVVYAVEEGVVEYLHLDKDGDGTQMVVSDADDATLGWYYMHLDDVFVEVGDVVLRDQALGTVVWFEDYTGFDHLHLQRVRPWSPSDGWAGAVTDAGNPLNWLTSRADAVAPRTMPHGAPVPAAVHLRFFEDGSTSAVTPTSLSGMKVDVVVRVEEIFPGAGAPLCGASVCTATTPMVHQIMPVRISFGIFRVVEDPADTDTPRTVIEKAFHNVIDLSLPFISDVDLAKHIYREDSLGTYTDRHFLVDLTHCQEDGTGHFEFAESGRYLLQVVLEDASGNVGVREMTVDIP